MLLKNPIFLKSCSLLLIFLLQYGKSDGDNGRTKIDSASLVPLKSLNEIGISEKKPLKFSARQSYIIQSRDSYVEAANSFGLQKGNGQTGIPNGQTSNGKGMSSYRIPQSSYKASMHGYGQNSNGYGYTVQNGGWGYDNEDNSEDSSKKDIIGLVGLLGLKGLKGTLPLLKLAAIALVILSPVLIPFTILKFFIILLKPVITFGRSLPSTQNYTGIDELYEKIETFMGRQLDKDNKCMERIACEGVLKSIPRIFMRILGETNSYKVLRKKRSVSKTVGEDDEVTLKSSRRKDLATLALKKLKTPQFLTKKPSLNENQEQINMCKQYQCTILF